MNELLFNNSNGYLVYIIDPGRIVDNSQIKHKELSQPPYTRYVE